MPKVKAKHPKKISNSKTPAIKNDGLGVGGGNAGFLPFFQGRVGSQQVSQPDSIVPNLRYHLITLNRGMLSQMFAEIGLIQTICCVPVADALRGGIELKSKQLSEDQIEELKLEMDQREDIPTVGLTAVWNRLFGGAGTLIFTDQDPETPLDITKIGPDTSVEFRSVDLWELLTYNQNLRAWDPSFQNMNFTHFTYYGNRIHRSRVLLMKGFTAPSIIRGQLRGWGLSVVEALINSMNQYLRASNVAYEVLDEFKLDIFKIKNLVNTLMSPNAFENVLETIARLNYTKNYQNAMVIDSEDDYQQKQLSFAGLGEAMEQIRMQVAADMRIPMLKLFGVAAKGLNASDEQSLEVYNGMVESEIRYKIKYDLLQICKIRCQQLFGMIPDDLTIGFAPLRIMSAEQEEKVKDSKFTRLVQVLTLGVMTPEQFVDSCNKDKLFAVTLDAPPEGFEPLAQEPAKEESEPKTKNSLSLENAVESGLLSSDGYWQTYQECMESGVSFKDMRFIEEEADEEYENGLGYEVDITTSSVIRKRKKRRKKND